MPIKRCQKDGKPGYKWGDSGECYVGDDAKQKAQKQGIAIELSQKEDLQSSNTAISWKWIPPKSSEASLPTPKMQTNALRGLELRAQYGKGGENLLVLTLSRKLAEGDFISNDEKKVLARLYNSRKRFAQANENTIGYINYLLLGGQETELWLTSTGSESL